MSFVTEILEEKPTVLIVARKNNQLILLLRQHLKKHRANIFFSPVIVKNLVRFDYIFFLNEENIPKKSLLEKHKKITCIYINNNILAQSALKAYSDHPVKIVSVIGDKILPGHIDKILWFAFSQAKESFLQLSAQKNAVALKKPWYLAKFRIPTGKKLIIIFLFFFLFLHIAFIPPFLASVYLFSRSAASLKQNNFFQAEKNYETGQTFYNIAKKIYKIPRASFLIFSWTFPDFLFKNTERAGITIQKSLNLQENAQEVFKLILDKDKTSDENRQLLLRLDTIKKNVNIIAENLSDLSQDMPASPSFLNSSKKDLQKYLDLIVQLKRILPYLDSILAKNSEKTYLLIFANNMELRPGGGFIGSFGLLRVKNFTVEEIKIYDVYDADGQLIAHIEPPEAIRSYLGQPNWFLRDSAFSPDFLENYAQAKSFLEKEMGINNLSGSLLLTTTAVQYILDAFPELYLPDFNEKVNTKNFYLKTQYYSEKNFFPGSIQKKNFLGALTKAILLDLENASPMKLAKALKQSLDEKQFVLYFDDPQLQKTLNSFYWSGRTIEPSCTNQDVQCISDYVFPFDANLGLNKVNFFVSRHANLKVSFTNLNKIFNTYSVQFNNDSADVFPGGTYRNYFQLLLPQNSRIKSITLDGVLVENYDEEVNQFKKIGLLLEIKPKSIAELKINYELDSVLKKGRNTYQLIAQKQIGASNSDFALELNIGKNLHLLNQNFPALVKDDRIIYNTSLTTDKIFFVELIKE